MGSASLAYLRRRFVQKCLVHKSAACLVKFMSQKTKPVLSPGIDVIAILDTRIGQALPQTRNTV